MDGNHTNSDTHDELLFLLLVQLFQTDTQSELTHLLFLFHDVVQSL